MGNWEFEMWSNMTGVTWDSPACSFAAEESSLVDNATVSLTEAGPTSDPGTALGDAMLVATGLDWELSLNTKQGSIFQPVWRLIASHSWSSLCNITSSAVRTCHQRSLAFLTVLYFLRTSTEPSGTVENWCIALFTASALHCFRVPQMRRFPDTGCFSLLISISGSVTYTCVLPVAGGLFWVFSVCCLYVLLPLFTTFFQAVLLSDEEQLILLSAFCRASFSFETSSRRAATSFCSDLVQRRWASPWQ